MLHDLKIKPEYLEAIISGEKTFEIRKNDRDYKVKDTLHLFGFEDDFYSGETYLATVSYIFHGTGEYGLAKGYVILGLTR